MQKETHRRKRRIRISRGKRGGERENRNKHKRPSNMVVGSRVYFQFFLLFVRAHPMRALMDYSVSLLLNDSEENLMSYLHRGILYNSLGR